ncbi:MAG: hypothetical protein R2856_38555 [Caldilineaceae bacterium]
METLILSDIHANIVAGGDLGAGRRRPIRSCTGDLVDYGPSAGGAGLGAGAAMRICTQGNHDG